MPAWARSRGAEVAPGILHVSIGLAGGYIGAPDFDSIVDPAKMVGDIRVAPVQTG